MASKMEEKITPVQWTMSNVLWKCLLGNCWASPVFKTNITWLFFGFPIIFRREFSEFSEFIEFCKLYPQYWKQFNVNFDQCPGDRAEGNVLYRIYPQGDTSHCVDRYCATNWHLSTHRWHTQRIPYFSITITISIHFYLKTCIWNGIVKISERISVNLVSLIIHIDGIRDYYDHITINSL